MDKPVAIVGVGNMGGAMAARLLELAWPVRVFDVAPAKISLLKAQGATACSDAADAARGCSALIVCVVDAHQTDEVLFGDRGAAAAMAPGQAVVLCPTIAPQDTRALARRLSDLRIDVIDAPMSGGPARA